MDNKKEQERIELHRTIWSIANSLRGSVDGWDFKQYVLGILFYRFISENFTNYVNKGMHEDGEKDFDYTKIKDKLITQDIIKNAVEDKGFFIYPSNLFCNVLDAARKSADKKNNLNDDLKKVFDNIIKSSIGTPSQGDLEGLFDDIDLNSKKLGNGNNERNKKIFALLEGINEMNLGDYKSNSIDAFGDAYEYLMTMYASNAGKSGGEFFTPQEVSILLNKIAISSKKKNLRVYDPACGSGSLLLQSVKLMGVNAISGLYGQEINITSYNLCRINMFLHDVSYNKFQIACGDTLTDPCFMPQSEREKFDVIVSNPPYGISWEGSDNQILINDERYEKAGVLAPKSKADFAFIMHSLFYLSETGTAAIVCFPGIMYRGGAEAKIREYLIDNNYIDCVILLPSNLFFGTSISACIMVLKKNKQDNKVLFIDASKEAVKVTNSNKLNPENIDNIYNLYIERKNKKHISYLASVKDIQEKEYNLSVSSYVEAKDTREKVDIDKLNKEISEIVARENVLRKEIDKIIREI